MGFDVTQLTQDEEQSLFTLKTDMPIPMLVYGDSFQSAKYGHHILPSSLNWTNHNKGSLHRTFQNSLIEFLCTDLDGNLSFTLNPLTPSKLDHYLSSLQEGLSETANKGQMFDEHLLNEQSKDHFITEIARIGLFAHRFPYPYSQIYSTRGLKSIQCWNQRLKYYSSSTFKRRHNLMNFTFLLEIFPHSRYGVRHVASLLLFMVQLEKFYSMHPLQCISLEHD
jgi:hypothetical protein